MQLEISKRIERALAQGARFTGGHRALPEQGELEPTILADVTPEMDIANEEVFGPIMLLMRAR